MERRIRPDQARLGMFVSGFGGAWRDHPFWLVRFVLKKENDVERVRRSGVPYVLIDLSRGEGPDVEEEVRPRAPGPLSRPVPTFRSKPAHPSSPSAPADYDKLREKVERQRARALVSQSLKVLARAFADVRLGRAVRLPEVTALVEDVVDFVERSPHTLLDILRLKKKDEYTYLHSVAVCTLMVNAARHMGKAEAETRDYGMAGLLHDLGKTGIPDAILDKPGKLTEAEFETIRTHPEYGYNVLAASPNMPEMALDVCRHHHEKMDGSGYPFGLPAEAISLVARLGAVCDVYDALTSERVYKGAWSPAEAVAAMWSWEGHLDRDLLFTFMQSIAVFPPGLAVKLRSGRLAVVIENKQRNLRPRVLAFYTIRDREFVTPEEIVIQDNLANDSIVGLADPADCGIDDWTCLDAIFGRPIGVTPMPRTICEELPETVRAIGR